MTVQELDSKFNQVINDLKGPEFGRIMTEIGLTAVKDIRERVTETGKDAEGAEYKPYSTTDMLLGCSGFKNKSHCSKVFGKGKNKELKWVTLDRGGKNIHLAVLEGGYRKFRELNELQSGFVDFAFSNRMWNSIGVIPDKMLAQQGVIRIGVIPGGDSELSNKKLKGNTERRTDILKLNKKEVIELSAQLNTKVQGVFEKYGLK